MTNWTKLFNDKMDDLFIACCEAQLEAIKAGKIDAVSGQAFQAVNEVLLYADGHIETLRHPGGCIIGDVFVGRRFPWQSSGTGRRTDGEPAAVSENAVVAVVGKAFKNLSYFDLFRLYFHVFPSF